MANAQNKLAGAIGRTDLPTFYPDQVLTLRDPGHILFGKVSTARYDEGDPKNQELADSIREVGVLQPGMLWQFRDSDKPPQVIFGTRRTLALRQANAVRLENGQAPLPMAFRLSVKTRFTPAELATALDLWATENNQREGNDWLTVAQGAAMQLGLGVPPAVVLARWPQIESESLLRRLTAHDGILTAAEPVKEALATRKITLAHAMRIAKLPYAEQAGALFAKKISEPKRKYLTPAKREELCSLISELQSGATVLTPDFVERLKQLAAQL